ncbi:MltF family protein [Vibrio panuliri]|uniref:Lytic transglycosylase F n=1 Tax=Vibrio panuliri TaxID=1381081 RepID=A0A1Q9H9F9_9VIBR|nr:lytic transglycosylase F [Vibrio panuliri]KAB1460166.1 lytic transglycosylase F [Vibrio panuliri]OLQ85565.1 lytic transglycosylase F [Vibrio panuliri]OLQ96409.1 lytic transglycosylase F [Vibrio panuliri]
MVKVILLTLLCLLPLTSSALSLTPLDKQPHFGDLPTLEKKGVIRVLVSADLGFYYIEAGQPKGILAELLYHFEKQLKKRSSYLNLQVIPVERDDLLPLLVQGYGDLVVANLTITEQRLGQVDFSTPVRKGVDEWIITNQKTPQYTNITQLSGKEFWVRASSSYFESLQALNNKLNKLGKPPVLIRFLQETLQDYEIMEMVNQGHIKATVLDSHKSELWLSVMNNIRAHKALPLRQHGEIAWAMRKQSPKLKSVVNQYLAKHRSGTLMGNVIYGKYLDSTRWLRQVLDPNNIRKLESLSQIFVKYSSRYNFDPLMISAQGYQESGLDQRKVSHMGAVGIMQVLPSTARDPNINIRNIYNTDSNIHAGVKYMRFIKDRYFNEMDITADNKVYFALAAYNAGPGNIRKMRRLARQQGYDENKWFKNVEIVTRRNIGREPVQYVSNINRYFIIYTQLALLQDSRSQSNHSQTNPLIFPIEIEEK